MAFYYESEDLNLRKKYNNLQYDPLEDNSKQCLAYQIPEQVMNNKEQDEQLVAEYEILQRDIRNMCVYFTQRYIASMESPQLLNFPFIKIKNRVCHIFEKYQEQKTLLDNILESLVVPLMEVVKVYVHLVVKQQIEVSSEEFHSFCDTVYILTKVKGVRAISRFCPHQVSDLEPVVMYLQMNSADLNGNWQTKYIILMWLSIIVLVPFDLSSIDSNLFQQVQHTFTSQNTIIACLLNLGVNYLKSSTKLRNMGALYLSKLFSRSDVLKTELLPEFLHWSVDTIVKLSDNILNTFYITGVLETLVEILKTGQRNELKHYLNILLPLLQQKSIQSGTLINLFVTKLTQRIGLLYLRPRIVAWAYSKGTSNLMNTLQSVDHSKIVTNVTTKLAPLQQQQQQQQQQWLNIEAVDYFADVDQDALEIVIDTLLQQITNKDTVVRWSAAKGIGRICARLDLEQADDIFQALLDACFSPINGDTAWHGGCLALGELCRRGLIIESKLQDVIPIICKALVFEQNQGGYSIGVNVRDSACYIAWSAARAYDPDVLQPHVLPLAQQLVTVMIFDREVNVRRAASSTFQELVGRCPNIIPHGISILTESDYFSLALLHNAYLRIAPFVASFPEYFKQMVDHLAFVKVASQDKEVRKLAAKALSRLLCLNPEYYKDNCIYQGLLNMAEQQQLNSRHGSLYALGDLLIAQSGNAGKDQDEKELKDSVFLKTLTKNDRQLAKAGEHITVFKTQYLAKLEQNLIHLLDSSIVQQIIMLPMKDQQLKGKSGELLRVAYCRLIECISKAQLPLTPEQHSYYLEFIEEGIKNPLEEIQNSAVKALRVLSNQYQRGGQFLQDGQMFLSKVLGQFKQSSKVVVLSGYAQCVGAFSAEVLMKFDISALFNVGLSKKRSKLTSWSLDPESRKFAIKSIGESMTSLLIANQCDYLIQSIDALLYGMSDYTINKRGDVGLFIRENAIIALQSILVTYVQYLQRHKCEPILTEHKITQIVGQLLQQLCEKIDRVRLLAGSVLQDLFRQVLPHLQKFNNYELIATTFSTQQLQAAIVRDEDRVDQSFQSEIIEAEIKNLKDRLLHMGKTELIYHWNLPHCCYQLIVPLLQAHNFTKYILIGLCVSVGGISESIQKYSEQALTAYIHNNQELSNILIASIEILQEYQLDERIIIPLFKTLSLILQKEEIHHLDDIKTYTVQMFNLIHKETHKSQSINKLSASVQVVVDILAINDDVDISKDIFKWIMDVLTSDLPKVRKQLADAFYLYLMSVDNEELITSDKSEQLQDFLLETDWLSVEIDKHMTEVKDQLISLMM